MATVARSKKPKGRAKKQIVLERPPADKPKRKTGRLITRPPIKRILKRAGIQRISHDVDAVVYEMIVDYTRRILAAATVFTEHAPRKTIQIADLEGGLQKHGQFLALGVNSTKRVVKKTTHPEEQTSIRTPKKPAVAAQEIPHNNFKELCKTIVSENLAKNYRFAAYVFDLLQHTVEHYVYDLAILAYKCAGHANHRQTVKAADFTLAREIRGW
jgi:histone H3/H4